MSYVFGAFIGGFCLRGALAAAEDDSAGWALVLGILATANLILAMLGARRSA